jgi:hypothetical protein
MIYLAIPYNHPDPEVREKRFKLANRIAGQLIKIGLGVFSPISHGHPIANEMGLGLAFETWQKIDYKLMDMCDIMLVVKTDGWKQSKGLRHEAAYMKRQGKTIIMLDADKIEGHFKGE